ncbi:hypothetical protein BH10ACT7_BH10ACT7_16470 [soil metagenome]
MTFFESIKTVFRKYAEFEGRATRPEFWWFALFSALVSGALGSLNIYTTTGALWGDGFAAGLSGTSSTIYLGASLAGLWGFAVLLPSLAVTVRRLRDAGHRWVEIFWILLPIAGLIILIVRLTDVTSTGVAPVAPATPVAPAPATPPAPAAKAPATTRPATTRPANKPAATKPTTPKPPAPPKA